MTRSKGFTLAELLVVMAVLMTLAAILMPVYTKAKDAASRSACVVNLRHLGLDVNLYRQDWDGKDVGATSADAGLPSFKWLSDYPYHCHGRDVSGLHVGGLGVLFPAFDISKDASLDPASSWNRAWPEYKGSMPILIDQSHQRFYPVSPYSENLSLVLSLDGAVHKQFGRGDLRDIDDLLKYYKP